MSRGGKLEQFELTGEELEEFAVILSVVLAANHHGSLDGAE